MPLSDLFRSSPKKEPAKVAQTEPVKPPLTDDSVFSPEMQKKRYDAAMEFIKIFQERMPLVGGKPHAGTVLAVAARLAGTSLFRAVNKNDFEPGVIVLSEEVNQACPQLLNLFAFHCQQNGMDIMARPLVTEFPQHDKPRMDVGQVQAEYQAQYDAVMKKHGLDYLNAARAGMVFCSTVFNYHCSVARDIDRYVATGIVAMGVVEGAKTAPPPLGPGDKMKNKTGNRLVLGERDAAIQEARDNGGIYTLHGHKLRFLKELEAQGEQRIEIRFVSGHGFVQTP